MWKFILPLIGSKKGKAYQTRKFNKDLKKPNLENLENRLAPAVNIEIGATDLPTTYKLTFSPTTAIFTATDTYSGGTATPAVPYAPITSKIGADLIQAQLAAGYDVIIDNGPAPTIPPQIANFPPILPTNSAFNGEIKWTKSVDFSTLPVGTGRTLTFRQDPSTLAGSIILTGNTATSTTPFATNGNSLNNIDLNFISDGAASSGIPKIVISSAPMTVGKFNIDGTNSAASASVRFNIPFTAIDDISIKAQLVSVNNLLDSNPVKLASLEGDISFTSTTPNNGGIISMGGAGTISAYGKIGIAGNIATTGTNPDIAMMSQTGQDISISGRLGDTNRPLGVVTFSSLGNVFVGGSGSVSKIAADPVQSSYNLTLAGGVAFNDSTAPTAFDNSGTIQLGKSTSNINNFYFAGGLDLQSSQNRVSISNSSLNSPSKSIELGSANLDTEVRINTATTASPAGKNVFLTESTSVAANTKLSFNSGTDYETFITNGLTNVGAITIDGSKNTYFKSPLSLGQNSPLTINKTQEQVVIEKASTLNQVTFKPGSSSIPGSSFSLNLNAPVNILGPVTTGSANQQIIMTGIGGQVAPISTIAGQSTSYFGNFTSSSSILAVNGNYPNSTASLKGGTLTGTGTVGKIKSIPADPYTFLAPGGFNQTSSKINGVTVLRNDPYVGTFTSKTIELSTRANLVIDIASPTSSDLLVSTSTLVAPSIGGATLSGNMLNYYVPTVGSKYLIVQNDCASTTPINGVFANAPSEGSTVNIGGYYFSVSYVGGDGNDIVLTAQSGSPNPNVTPTPGNGDYVFYLYNSILGRNPDVAGYNTFLNQLNSGVSRSAIASALYYSAEQRSNQVQGYYQTYLNRTATAAEVNGWVNYFLAGATDYQVQTSFLTSNEFMTQNPPITNYIQGLYNHILGRSANASEVAGWTKTFFSSVPRQQIVMSMLTSTEATRRQAALDYNQYLGRAGDASGITYWGSVIATMGPGAGVIGFTSSGEAYNRAQLLY